MRLPETYTELRKQTLEQEGMKYPGKALVAMELEPGYERAKNRMLPYIQAINEAHLIMLMEQGIVDENSGNVILKALGELDQEFYKNTVYDGRYEDLYFYMESKLIEATDGIAGNLHLARSRNDMCVAWSHMAVRDGLLQAMEQFLYLKNAIVLFAEEHKDTLYVIHTHTQHAQPGLLGLTTTGFPVSRERVAELAGFSGMIENAYDAIGNSDYLTQTASALGLCALDMGRIVTDLLLWATQEMNMIHVADGYISISSIMPQKRNPIALEHLRSSLSVLKGMADTVLTGFLKSPYGDISDYEDIEDSVFGCLELFQKNVQLFRAVISTLEVNKELLESRAYERKNVQLFRAVISTLEVNKELLESRAYESFSVVTDIADQMYRSYKIPFRKAHSFVSFLVKKAGTMDYNLKNISEEFFSSAYHEFFGEPFAFDFTPISQCINPWHFVKCREVRGGTGDKAMKSMIDRAKKEVEANLLWIQEHKKQLREAAETRKQVIQKKLDKF